MILCRALHVFMLVLISLPAAAQVDRATLTGTVTDVTGAVVPGAKVEALSTATALHREVLTGAAGTYQMPALPIGNYTVTISKAGLETVQFKDVELSVGQSRTVDARMGVGGVETQVEVVAAAAPVNLTSAEVGGVIESQQVRDIPLNGRNWASLMTLAPGAINVGGGSQTSIRFVGRSRDDNNFTFDGIDASGVQEQPQKADARLNISLDSIAEFRVNSAVYTAESGTTGGAQVNVVSKSGSNTFHGGSFEFVRNGTFDARSPFDPSTLPPFRMNQFGANLGGPVVKNRTFFFANYEGLRQRLEQTLIGFVPSAAFRQRAVATSPSLAPLIQAYPAGQTPIDANTDQLSVQRLNSITENSVMFRVDHRFSDNTTIFVRYNIDDAFLDRPNGALGSRDTTKIQPSNLVVQLQHIFSSHLINEAKVGMNRSAFHHPTLGLAPVTVSVPGFDDLPTSALDVEVGTTFNWVDNLTVIHGRHTWKMGTEIRRIHLNNTGNGIDTAAIAYSSTADFINNAVDSVGLNAALGMGYQRRTLWMGYGQDEIKARSNLTLNLGLRYEYYSVMHELTGHDAVVDIVGCGGFCPPGTPYYSPDRNNFGPRIGLAWSPAIFKDKTTAIRTGFGMYYGPGQNDDFSDPHESTAGRFALSSADLPTLSYPITPFLGNLQTQGLSPKGIDRNRRDLYYENWDVLIQQQLPHHFVGQAGYIGSEGHNLFTSRATNLLDPVTRKRPLAQFGQFSVKHNDANSAFNALQASLQRSFTSGWLWQTQYMWSHAITDGSVGAGESVAIQNAACRRCDRSDAPFDVRHTMTTNWVYQLPLGRHAEGAAGKLLSGWELSGLATASTGRPVNIVVTRSASDMPDGNRSNQRPDVVPGMSIIPPGGQTLAHWFNPAAFTVPAKGTWGNAGRNIGRGPGYWETDLGIEKRTPVSGKGNLSFRAEAFNVLNHPIYGNPAGNISASSTFGRVTNVLNNGATGTGTPRKLQFMVRFEF
jgi:hypothetical protein